MDGCIRITAQLVDATTSHSLWAERYDRPLQDIFAVQDKIVRNIATALNIQLSLWGTDWSLRRGTDNVEAYGYYLRAFESCSRHPKESNAKARELGEKALDFDPQYADVYALFGMTYLFDFVFQWSQDPQTLQRAVEVAQKAVALDDASPRAHAVLGLVYQAMKQHDQAIAAMQRALPLIRTLRMGTWGWRLFLSLSGDQQKRWDGWQRRCASIPGT